ncbi:sensor histidine kinase [Amycolatopsis sp. AA4]|uniref:sensor histidine kinase n=1 Tax=Actinomycetes TaxID=1760 RepID=UPI0001B57053|nr:MULTISPECIES: HAMP domain-containing sensor histidine kinase [Actinomycetes]ATY12290.1 sensor histidine kinase [Amycolatopsis sp. AA4]EFL08030.1 phosphate regulon sensor kinase PhoR [Streptomyces sp. AA4]
MTRGPAVRTRIALLSAVCVALAVGATATAAYFFFDRELHRQLDVGLTREANRIQLEIKAGRSGGTGVSDCEWIATPACSQIVRADQPAPDPGSPANLPVTAETREVAAGRLDRTFSDAVVRGHPLRLLAAPLGEGRALQVGVRADGVEQSLSRIRMILLGAGVAGILLAAVLGYFVARAGLRPLTAIARTSKRIAETRDPGVRIEARGNDEIAQLARTFNAMLAALEESLTAQRRLVADASHELRTPLTSLRSDIDLLALSGPLEPEKQDRILKRIHRQFAGMTQLVADLIELARGDEPDTEPEDVRLDVLAKRAVADAAGHWPSVRFRTELEPAVVEGNPETLRSAVANLLDNAAKFGEAGDTVSVELRDGVLTVRDEGPGIAAEELPKIFDRFYRGPSARSRPGSGLGLAIVAKTARAHDARISVDSPPGGGTAISIAFPDAETPEQAIS